MHQKNSMMTELRENLSDMLYVVLVFILMLPATAIVDAILDTPQRRDTDDKPEPKA